jgi:long-chain acyl-CoA synthetase
MISENLFDAVATARARRPDHTGLIIGDERLPTRDLLAEADRVAGGLVASGLRPGDCVSVLSDNRPEILVLYLALARAGAVYVPINPNLAPPEIAWILDRATPGAIFVSDAMRPRWNDARTLARHAPELLSLDPPPHAISDWQRLAGHKPLGESRGGGKDGVIVCYTSATTGTPKGVRASHAAELASARSFEQVWAIRPDDVLLNGLPLAYIYGLATVAITGLVAGVPSVLMERFDGPKALELIERHRCTIFPAVPTMHAMLLECRRLSKRSHDTSSLRLPVSSGARLPATVAEQFRAAFGVPIYEFYASSECRPIFAWDLTRGDVPRQGCVGPCAPGVEARIVDEAEQNVPDGTDGNLFVRGPSLMTDYFRDPELTNTVLRDGWFDTGDRARREPDGAYTIGSRNKEMINRGGAKVAPPEVEAVLLAHPAVHEAAVVGVPDPAFGEQVKAVLVLKPGMAAGIADIRRHCRERLADFKVPGLVVFVDALPTGPTGKVLKRALIDL